jgi:hypothetical protein
MKHWRATLTALLLLSMLKLHGADFPVAAVLIGSALEYAGPGVRTQWFM